MKLSMKGLLMHRQTKGAETDRPFLQMIKPALYSTLILPCGDVTLFPALVRSCFQLNEQRRIQMI